MNLEGVGAYLRGGLIRGNTVLLNAINFNIFDDIMTQSTRSMRAAPHRYARSQSARSLRALRTGTGGIFTPCR